ncbi:MAG: hypothetical protein H7Z42_10805 [Roseiflexaceae bacterium]|nr:hypothetical protein [Roseiflexaceae bacterium]
MFNIEALEIDELERLRDAVNRKILAMRRTTGLALPELLRLLDEVKTTLGDQGKEWHSLERWQYMDGEIRFWLNPRDHELYNTGWFSIDDLIAWARASGPVMNGDLFDEQADDEVLAPSISWLRTDALSEDVVAENMSLRIQRFDPS